MPILSYSLTLSQNIYPTLDRLFSVYRSLVNGYINSLWNERGLSLLESKSKAWALLSKSFPKPQNIPSRLCRCALEMAGQILKSQIERKRLFDALLQGQKLKVEEKLTYKAQLKGIELIKVDPAYTSSYYHK